MRIKILDDFLLNLFQRFSDWSYECFGVSNFWWARTTSCVAMLIISLISILGHLPFFIVLVPMFGIYMSLQSINRVEEKTRSNLEKKGCANAEAQYWGNRLRLIFLLFWVIPLFPRFPLFVTSVFFIVLSAYFAACTPKPTKKSKLRKLLETLRETWLITPSPTPA